MSRNIRQNLKYLNTTYIKTISKQNTETQLDFDLSSFQISNHFSKKNSVNNTKANTYTNSNNTSKQCTNSKTKHKKNSKKKFFSTFSKDNNLKYSQIKSHSKYIKNNNINYLIQNNSLNKENKSFSLVKKRIQKNSLNSNFLYLKPSSLTITKTEYNNSINSTKISKKIMSKEKNRYKRELTNFNMKKSNTMKNINIKKINKQSNITKKLDSLGLNKFIIKTNINSPLHSYRKDNQIIKLHNDLNNKKNEINNLKKRINEQNKYIYDLENKIKIIKTEQKGDDEEECEQYSKKMILRNIKALTIENEELHKQINEYKNKEIKIMKALYYINKKGISIDDFLDNNKDNK